MLRVVGLFALVAAAAAQGHQPRYNEPEAQAGPAPVQKQSPITRVTTMLQDMQANCVKEGKEAAALKADHDCWCNTNRDEKTAAVKLASNKVLSAKEAVQELSAKIVSSEGVMAAADDEMSAAQASIDQAAAERQKQNDEWSSLDAQLTGSMNQLKGAIKSLSKVNGKAFLQVASTLKHMPTGHWSKYSSELHQDLMSMLAAYPAGQLRGQPTTMLAQAPGYQSGAAASGPIFGIIQQLLEGQEKDHKAGAEREAAQAKAFGEFQQSKQAQIAAAKSRKTAKFQEGTQAKVDKSNANNDIQNNQKALDADSAFLVSLEDKCATFNKEYDATAKTRSEEIEAIGEALKILMDENSRALFDRTSAVQFLQMDSFTQRRTNLVKFLRSKAVKSKSFSLLALAGHASLDSFKVVVEKMDEMNKVLKAEQQQEYEDNNNCGKDLMQNENQRDDAKNDVEDHDAAAQEAKESAEQLQDDMDKLAADVVAARVSIKEAGEQRKKENLLYQSEVKDQRATVSILNRVMEKLNAFYKDKTMFLQTTQQPQASGVMIMLGDIIRDAEKGTKEAVETEQDSQNAYNDFLSESNTAVSQAQKSIADKRGQRAQATKTESDANSDKRDSHEELMGLQKVNADLHKSCDFLMKNYDARQEARSNEMDSIAQAKAILKGSNFSL